MCRLLIVSLFTAVSYAFSDVLAAISLAEQQRAISVLQMNFTSMAAKDVKKKAAEGWLPAFNFYESYTYDKYMMELNKLKSSCKDIFSMKLSSEKYTGTLYEADYFKCGSKKCEMPIVELSGTLGSKTLPQMYVSGAVHGNERMGPAASLEFLKMACYMYDASPVMTYLINSRSIWFHPTTNPLGYYESVRYEKNFDINSDFPYRNTTCMNTIAGRFVNELFLEHLFQIVISLHGGMRAIGWQNGIPFTPSSRTNPDAHDGKCHNDIGQELNKAAGKVPILNPFSGKPEDFGPLDESRVKYHYYKYGLMAETVYDKNATIEDWAYGASWDPQSDTCTRTTVNGLPAYPVEKTQYKDQNNPVQSMRAVQYIVEIDKDKDPDLSLYGHSYQVGAPQEMDGLISRVVRILTKATEYLQPDVLLLNYPTVTPPSATAPTMMNITFSVLPVGCNKLNTLVAKVHGNGCNSAITETSISIPIINAEKSCSGLEIWGVWNDATPILDYTNKVKVNSIQVNLNVNVTAFKESNQFPLCVKLEATFDQHWSHESDPAETHLAKARTLDTYELSTAESNITEKKVKVMPLENHWGTKYSKGIQIQTETTVFIPDTELTYEPFTVIKSGEPVSLTVQASPTNVESMVNYTLKLHIEERPAPIVPPFWDFAGPKKNYQLKQEICLTKVGSESLVGNVTMYFYDVAHGLSHLMKEPVEIGKFNLATLSDDPECFNSTAKVYASKQIQDKINSGTSHGALTSIIYINEDTVFSKVAFLTIPKTKHTGYQTAQSLTCILYDENKIGFEDMKKADFENSETHMKQTELLLQNNAIGHIAFPDKSVKGFGGTFCPNSMINVGYKFRLKGGCTEINATMNNNGEENGFKGYKIGGELENLACSTEQSAIAESNYLTLTYDGENEVLGSCILQADVDVGDFHKNVCADPEGNASAKVSLFGFILLGIVTILICF